jgi:hypothetical protein
MKIGVGEFARIARWQVKRQFKDMPLPFYIVSI